MASKKEQKIEDDEIFLQDIYTKLISHDWDGKCPFCKNGKFKKMKTEEWEYGIEIEYKCNSCKKTFVIGDRHCCKDDSKEVAIKKEDIKMVKEKIFKTSCGMFCKKCGSIEIIRPYEPKMPNCFVCGHNNWKKVTLKVTK